MKATGMFPELGGCTSCSGYYSQKRNPIEANNFTFTITYCSLDIKVQFETNPRGSEIYFF
ncbi:MAG: hypothetical protein CM15mP42_04460 [Methanobacteriota archaeon]|nr:MAG: hypothetical protein CM15mP42_04460 [Euryarchaeota archaeon]